MTLPTNVGTGRVTGRFIVGVADGPDADAEPDMIPASGTITFTPSVPYLPNPAESVTILKTAIVTVLDDQGYLCTPDPADPTKPGARGVRLVATDDPDLSVQGWTWNVTYNFASVNGTRPSITAHSIALPEGATVDLTSLVKVPSPKGIGTEQAEALAAAATAAALEASLAAQSASEAAQATDVGVASMIDQADTDTAAAVMGRVRSRQTMIDTRDYGTVGDGVADDTAALAAAFAAADAGQAAGTDATVFVPAGIYRVSSPLTVASNLDAAQATFRYYGEGAALTVGSTSTTVFRRHYRLPRLNCNTNTAAGPPFTRAYENAIIGARLVNLNACKVENWHVAYFDEGLVFEGAGQGFVHTTIDVGTTWGCRRGIVLRQTNGGWVNQNNFMNGRVHVMPSWGTANDPESNSIKMEGGNNNTFVGTSVEAPFIGNPEIQPDLAQYRVDIKGSNNMFINCRWERQSGGPRYKIIWRQGSQDNVIWGGYLSWALDETFEADTKHNQVIPVANSFYARATSLPEQAIGSSYAALKGWNNTAAAGATWNAEASEFTPRQGRWRVTAKIAVGNVASGTVDVRLMIGGSARDVTRLPASAITRATGQLEYTGYFTGTETVRVEAAASAGAATTVSGAYICQIHAEYIR